MDDPPAIHQLINMFAIMFPYEHSHHLQVLCAPCHHGRDHLRSAGWRSWPFLAARTVDNHQPFWVITHPPSFGDFETRGWSPTEGEIDHKKKLGIQPIKMRGVNTVRKFTDKKMDKLWWKYGGLKAPTNGDKLQCDASKCNYQKWALRWCQHKLLFQSRIVKSDWLQLAEVLVLTELLTKSSQFNVGQHSPDPTIEYPAWIMGSFHLQCFWGALGAPRGLVFLSAPFVKRLDTSILSKIRRRILLLLNKNTPS